MPTHNLTVVWSDATTTTGQYETRELALLEAQRWLGDRFYSRGRRHLAVFVGNEHYADVDLAPLALRLREDLGLDMVDHAYVSRPGEPGRTAMRRPREHADCGRSRRFLPLVR